MLRRNGAVFHGCAHTLERGRVGLAAAEQSVPAVPAVCVDATGAGDAYWGAFLATLLAAGLKYRTRTLTPALVHRALRRGAIADSLCIRKKGAIESLPTAQEVDRLEKEVLL